MRRVLITLALVGVLAGLVPFLPLHGQTAGQPFNYWVPPAACTSVVSGNSTGTQGQTTAGTSNTPVVQAQTSAVGTNTHTYICNISPPGALTATGTRVTITDALVAYSSTTVLGTQATVAASGTFNGTTVFTLINYPPAGPSETVTTLAPVRADAGSLTIVPAVASFNTSTQTAGTFFTVDFQPAGFISWNTDLQQLLLNFTLQAAAGVATTTNLSGIQVHIRVNY